VSKGGFDRLLSPGFTAAGTPPARAHNPEALLGPDVTGNEGTWGAQQHCVWVHISMRILHAHTLCATLVYTSNSAPGLAPCLLPSPLLA